MTIYKVGKPKPNILVTSIVGWSTFMMHFSSDQ